MREITVAADGSGEFTSIQAAVDSIPDGFTDPTVIRIKEGVYKEKLVVGKPAVALIGESAERTILTYDDYAQKTFPDGELYHTFHSYTLLVTGDDFTAERMTIENAAGPGEAVGQAIAAYVDADRAVFRECRLLGHQDTLFTGPLPPAPRDRATFGGPRDGAPRRPVRQYYERCHIEGDIDFIFGSATAVFEQCDIVSRRGGWITAASTPQEVPYGYVFHRCRLTGAAPDQSVYLGRPWRNYAKVAFIACWMGAHIKPDGWSAWNEKESVRDTEFAEFGSQGPGAYTGKARVEWSRQLTADQTERYAASHVLAGSDGWNPVKR
ncbi:pectinesterase family protein [Paenibacillus chartarius]|uniref:Pectinesterase n=1 Tax=Paenibacillus chartarius TaxID=747481 RepID=A0ABV6DJ44_9BACL